MRNYLEALEAHKPKRGRKRTPDSMNKRLAKIDAEYARGRSAQAAATGPGAARSPARAEQLRATRSISARSQKEFVEAAAKAYGERKGITYAAWREVGVPDAVLKTAGITRAS